MFQKSKYLLIGLVTGLIMATATFAMAANPIKLIVNGQEIQCDVPPQNINGRVLVPARFVAESLGASVTWDGAKNAVVITSAAPLAVEEKNISSPTVEEGEQGVKETAFKGLKAIEVDGKIYFGFTEWTNKMRNTGKEVKITWDDKTFNIQIDDQNVVIPKKDAIIYKEIAYIDSQYYID
jgi:hypothetical protein